MKYLFFILSISSLASCSLKNNEALSQIEELQSKVNKLQNKFDLANEKPISDAKKQYDQSLFLIKKYYFKDTVDVQFMNSLDYYKNIKYTYKAIKKNEDIINNNFEIANNQLSTLKEDLNNTAIQGDKLKAALLNENTNAAKLDSAVTFYIDNVDKLLLVHDSIAGYIKNKTLSF